jgi:hypothetical protein
MYRLTRASVVALVTAGMFVPATSIARPLRFRDTRCAKTYTPAMIRRAILATYRGTRHVTRSERQKLRRMRRCDRRPATRSSLLRLNRATRAAWLLRVDPLLPYGRWAIPGPIVMCESHGQNLPPNGAGASGYYQIIPSTWRSYGGAGYAAYLTAKPEQDTVASRIWAGGAGASQWTCAGMVAW